MTTSYRNIFLLACCQALLLTNAAGPHLDERPRRLFAGRRSRRSPRSARRPTCSARRSRRCRCRCGWRRVGRRRGFMTGALVNIGGCALAALALCAAQLRAVLRSRRRSSASTTRSGCSTGSPLPKSPRRRTRRARSRWCSPAASSAASSGPAITRWGRDLFAAPFLGSFLLLAAWRWSRSPCSRRSTCPSRRRTSARGGGRPLREIVRQPVFVVAALAAALGYGLMNLLMTATPLAMDFCSLPYSQAATRDLVARRRHVRAGLRHRHR